MTVMSSASGSATLLGKRSGWAVIAEVGSGERAAVTLLAPDLARGAAPADALSPRVRDVVQRIAEECASVEVARFLGIKPQ
jgi:FixJ family two-component response regulator